MTRVTSNLITYGKIDLERQIAFGATAQVELYDFGVALSYMLILSCAKLNSYIMTH